MAQLYNTYLNYRSLDFLAFDQTPFGSTPHFNYKVESGAADALPFIYVSDLGFNRNLIYSIGVHVCFQILSIVSGIFKNILDIFGYVEVESSWISFGVLGNS